MRVSLNILAALMFGAAGLIGYSAYADAQDASAETEAFTAFVIERGQSARTIGENLEAADLIDSAFFFRMSLRLSGRAGDIQAGEYAIPAGAALDEIVDIITTGDVIQRSVTIPEGLTSWQIVQLLNANTDLSGDISQIPAEGSLLPETYAFTAGDTRQDILDRASAAMMRTLAELWEDRSSNVAVSTPQEAIILASIIEKETGVNSERGLVSSVYSNRLTTRGWRLQADPTIIYGLTDGRMDLGRGIRRSELDDAGNPYNTYRHDGLPPGPIANPGRAAILAALNPVNSDYFFFVADCQGGHNFGRTLAEHNQNVAAFRANCG